jgi:hypothetical protein
MPVNVITHVGFSTVSSPKFVINVNSFKILKYPLHVRHAWGHSSKDSLTNPSSDSMPSFLTFLILTYTALIVPITTYSKKHIRFWINSTL